MQPEILYEDNHIIIAVKPANIPVQADESGDADMLTLLKAYVKDKYNKPGNVYLGLVHRLDRPVGGVMVFARTSKAAERLSSAFLKKQAQKKYAAIVCGRAEPHDFLECYMRKDESSFSSYICDEHDSGAKYAALHYRRTAQRDNLSLLDIDLKTGRHHQIRVQLSSQRMPIYGDHRYNTAFSSDNKTNIALFAYSLSFEHPTLHENMTFTAVPKGGVWDGFSTELSCMAEGAIPAYCDDNIIVCDKQRGLTVAADDGGDDTLEGRLKKELPEVYPVHRIDATTEGLVLFARNVTARDELLRAFSAHDGSVEKYYTCTVIGRPAPKKAILTAYLTKDERRGRVYVNDKKEGDAKEIITEYEVLSTHTREGVPLSALKIHLVTGRTHQIRAHMAYVGYPLLGDDKYGDREVNRQLHVRVPDLRSDRTEFHFDRESPLSYLNNTVIE